MNQTKENLQCSVAVSFTLTILLWIIYGFGIFINSPHVDKSMCHVVSIKSQIKACQWDITWYPYSAVMNICFAPQNQTRILCFDEKGGCGPSPKDAILRSKHSFNDTVPCYYHIYNDGTFTVFPSGNVNLYPMLITCYVLTGIFVFFLIIYVIYECTLYCKRQYNRY